MTPFDQFKSKLEAAGVTLHMHDKYGPYQRMWVQFPNNSLPVRILVNDDETRGYSIYIESREMKIDEDVKTILAFQDA